ncbi:actin-histidine N-methyltransferase isoform X5 [Festucalex cinctus]
MISCTWIPDCSTLVDLWQISDTFPDPRGQYKVLLSNAMGKKSRTKIQKSGSGPSALPSPKEMTNLIAELLQKCSSEAPSASEQWEEYVQIRNLVEKIRKKQKGMSVVFEGCRHSYFQSLVSWAKSNGSSCDGVQIANFGKEGFGLQATRDIKAEELFLCIPRKILMTLESAKNSILGTLIHQDRILKTMGNVALALHLLCERASSTSMWLPYIRSLPQDYSTPLYYQPEEVQLLLGTQAIQDVFSQFKNTARQYAYFYKLLQTHPAASVLPLKDNFTFDDYRWAVSSVMTRQNQIPTEDGSQVTQALIPLWDMCNHTNGLSEHVWLFVGDILVLPTPHGCMSRAQEWSPFGTEVAKICNRPIIVTDPPFGDGNVLRQNVSVGTSRRGIGRWTGLHYVSCIEWKGKGTDATGEEHESEDRSPTVVYPKGEQL